MAVLELVSANEFFDVDKMSEERREEMDELYSNVKTDIEIYVYQNLIRYGDVEYRNQIIQLINDDKMKFVQDNRPNYKEIFERYGYLFDENDKDFLSGLDKRFFDILINNVVSMIFPNLSVYNVDFEKRIY